VLGFGLSRSPFEEIHYRALLACFPERGERIFEVSLGSLGILDISGNYILACHFILGY
jgi:hypothetical protein